MKKDSHWNIIYRYLTYLKSICYKKNDNFKFTLRFLLINTSWIFLLDFIFTDQNKYQKVKILVRKVKLFTKTKWSEVTQSCPTLCDLMDCSPPGSLVRGIFQAWILGWVAIPFSKGSSWPRDQTQVSYTVGRFFTAESPGKPLVDCCCCCCCC